MSRVGPGNPPVASRFRKGASGNPKGRPKAKPHKARSSSGSAFDVIVDRTLTITRGGLQREVTMEEALQHRTYQDALAGNRPARRQILKMIAKREKWLAEKSSKTVSPVELRTEPVDPTNTDEALLLLGIANHNPAREAVRSDRAQLLLEPWAVQAALSRRREGTRLTDKQKAEVIRCTRAADTIRWPRRAD